MGTDNHRPELLTNGNVLAVYHNDLNTGWTSKTATMKADEVHLYVLTNFTNNGPAPTWVIMNEISSGTWPGNSTYRAWVIGVATRLHTTYGYNVIMFSPFSNPASNSADRQLLAAHAYIGVENYLSGEEVKAQNFSVSWCQSQYQSSKTSYMNRGVPASKIFIAEEFQQTVSGTGWGRAGVSVADWNATITARTTAIQNVNFAGFLSYAWGKNNMGVSDAEMIEFEDTYASQSLPTITTGVTVSEWSAQ